MRGLELIGGIVVALMLYRGILYTLRKNRRAKLYQVKSKEAEKEPDGR